MDSISSLINFFIREIIDAFPNLSKVIGALVVSLTIASVALSALKVGFLVAKSAGAQFAFTLNAIRTAFNILKIAFLTTYRACFNVNCRHCNTCYHELG
ncbi:hypothetical protein ABXK73_01990 [Campylobacter jejuni]